MDHTAPPADVSFIPVFEPVVEQPPSQSTVSHDTSLRQQIPIPVFIDPPNPPYPDINPPFPNQDPPQEGGARPGPDEQP